MAGPASKRSRLLESGALAEEVRRHILSFLSLTDLLTVNCASAGWRRRSLLDARWVPAVAPPKLRRARALSSREDGAALCAYFVAYVRWVRGWLADAREGEEALMARRTALDGFFSLAPWAEARGDGAWLARALTPWTAPDAPQHGDAPPLLRRSPRLPARTADDVPCTFFQKRDEPFDEDLSPREGAPILAEARPGFEGDPRDVVDELCRLAARPRDGRLVRRVSLEPLSVLARGTWPAGAALPPMRDVAETLRFLEAARKVVDCYLGPGSATVRAVRTVSIDDAGGLFFRKIRSEFFMFGHDLGLNARALDDLPRGGGLSDWGVRASGALCVYAVAPHLFFDEEPGDEARVRLFAAPVRGDANDRSRPYCVSTGAPHFFNDPKMRMRAFSATVLHAVLAGGAGLPVCENWCCVLNPISCFGDLAAHSLLCCPGCFRRLQLNRVLPDVDATLSSLAALLQTPDLNTVSSRDLRELAHWGYVPYDVPRQPVVDLT